MKGTILGYDAATFRGMIRGDDGGRYEFDRLAWKSPSAPRNGVEVDFIVKGGAADEIYPILAAAGGGGYRSAPSPGYGASSSYGAGGASAPVNIRAPAIFAAVILIGSFLPLLAIPDALGVVVRSQTAGLVDPNISLVGLYNWISIGLAYSQSLIAQTFAYSTMAAGGVPQIWPFYLIYAIFLIPILSAWVLVAEFSRPGGASRTLKFWCGLISLLGLHLIPVIVIAAFLYANNQGHLLWQSSPAPAYGGGGNGFLSFLQIPYGVGWLMVMAGGGLMLASLSTGRSSSSYSAPSSYSASTYSGSSYASTYDASSRSTPTRGSVHVAPGLSSGPSSYGGARSPSYDAPAYTPPPSYSAAPTYGSSYESAPAYEESYAAPAARGFVFRPALILAVALLVGCFLPLFATAPGQPSYSLFGLYDPFLAFINQQTALSGQSFSVWHLLFAVYAIPLIALWILFCELTNWQGQGASLAMRILAAFWAFLAPVAMLVILPQVSDVPVPVQPIDMRSFDYGGFTILGAGCLFLLNAVGLIPTPPRHALEA